MHFPKRLAPCVPSAAPKPRCLFCEAGYPKQKMVYLHLPDSNGEYKTWQMSVKLFESFRRWLLEQEQRFSGASVRPILIDLGQLPPVSGFDHKLEEAEAVEPPMKCYLNGEEDARLNQLIGDQADPGCVCDDKVLCNHGCQCGAFQREKR